MSDLDEDTRIPTLAELTALLEKYFVGATDLHAAKLLGEVTAVLGDPARFAGETIAFDPANGRRCYGLAWREELAYDSRQPRSIELAAWLASTVRGFPPARPYCPDIFVGTWTQKQPVVAPAPRWELMLDGTFICDAPVLRSREAWRVHRQGSGPVGDALWLDDDLRIAHKSLLILGVSSTELVLQLPGTATEYKLVRS